jgi:hypothetical protein
MTPPPETMRFCCGGSLGNQSSCLGEPWERQGSFFLRVHGFLLSSKDSPIGFILEMGFLAKLEGKKLWLLLFAWPFLSARGQQAAIFARPAPFRSPNASPETGRIEQDGEVLGSVVLKNVQILSVGSVCGFAFVTGMEPRRAAKTGSAAPRL